MRKRNIQHTTPANRNVSYDLEFGEAEARFLAMGADVVAASREHIKGWGRTRNNAEKIGHHAAPCIGPDDRCLAGIQRGQAAGVGFSSEIATYTEVGGLIT